MKRPEGETDAKYIERLEGRDRQRLKDIGQFASSALQRDELIGQLDETIQIQKDHIQHVGDRWRELACELAAKLDGVAKSEAFDKITEMYKLARTRKKGGDIRGRQISKEATAHQELMDVAYNAARKRAPNAKHAQIWRDSYPDYTKAAVDADMEPRSESTFRQYTGYGS